MTIALVENRPERRWESPGVWPGPRETEPARTETPGAIIIPAPELKPEPLEESLRAPGGP